jgi:hypothetical protein
MTNVIKLDEHGVIACFKFIRSSRDSWPINRGYCDRNVNEQSEVIE